MTNKALIVLAKSGPVTASGASREFPEFGNYHNLVVYIQVTAFSATTIDFILRAYNPRHVNDGTNTPQFNIMNDMDWTDGNGATIALTATAEGNSLRFSATGKARGRMKASIPMVDQRLDLRWIYAGAGSVTFDAMALGGTEE